MGDVELGLRATGDFRRLVAIKRLRSEHRADDDFRRMFLEEAKLAGLIRHPNVVSVLDVGEDERGPFLIMDFIEGLTAEHVLKVMAERDEQLPQQIVLCIIGQVASGLAAVHELRGTDGAPLELIHRDVSPQNIMIGFDGLTRVTDFGIAKTTQSKATTTGVLKGKVGYMSPEQLRFERPTQSTDLFSLGVVLFELLSSRRLYRGKDAIETAQRILTEPAPDLFAIREDVPPELVELAFELLSKQPAGRPSSAREVSARIARVLEELVAVEGVLSVEEYLASELADEVEQTRTRTEGLVKLWERTGAETTDRTHGRSPGAPRDSRRRRVFSAVALGAFALVGSAAGASWMFAREGRTPSIAEPPTTAVSLPEDSVQGVSSTTPASLDLEATGAISEERDGTEAGAEEQTERAARRARRARIRRARVRAAREQSETSSDEEPREFRALDLIQGSE